MLAILNNTLLKLLSEVVQHLPSHCFWYSCNFVKNEIICVISIDGLHLNTSGVIRGSNHKGIDLVIEWVILQ